MQNKKNADPSETHISNFAKASKVTSTLLSNKHAMTDLFKTLLPNKPSRTQSLSSSLSKFLK
jgi:hypothetical protein